MDPRRWNSVVVDEDGVLKHKHQVLLQEYLVLQKECVSKKRKIKEAKQRKQSLMDEIRFLKRRRDYLLLKTHSQKQEAQHEAIQPQKLDPKLPKYNGETSRKYFDINQPPIQNVNTVGSMWKPGTSSSSSSVRKEKVGYARPRYERKSKDLYSSSNGKAEKRKISWQDPLALKV